MRKLMGLLAALVVLLTALPVAPAMAGPPTTPAERAREIAQALAKNPVYIDPAYASAYPAATQTEIGVKAKALGYPVYTVILPLTAGDFFRGEENTALTLIMDAMQKPGLYVLVDGGGRFPWHELRGRTEPDYDKVSAARKRALDDTGYNSGPAQVLIRMYELLALPSLPPATAKPGKSTPSRESDSGDGSGFPWWIVGGVAVLALLVLAFRRGGRGRGRGKQAAFSIPPHVAVAVADEKRRKLTRDAGESLTSLGEQLASLPVATSSRARELQQRALDAHQAAGRVLDGSDDIVDVVGATVLLDLAQREYDAAQAVEAGRQPADVRGLCAFNPLHGRSTGGPTTVESDGHALELPLCRACQKALRRGAAPASLRGADGPYWHGDDLWARTFFGSVGDNLADAVGRGEHRS
ncbi:hypothetical protein OG394_27655 [Kribbella sp. NBC_01245]|uniref:hypothetical protein n=1 Tax=Kribbella sp. NBC_01245 TaxID=2903578 RepID=UPI002E2C9528|nr:hypothetical protein [Kribbella sp. NBC_01245]